MAQETGWDLTRVTRYAEPPLRERAYVAQCASEVQLHQARGSVTLAALVCSALNRKPEELVWDSAYIDGQWLVRINVAAGSEDAQWSYEPSGKSVNPLNPTARTLMGLDPARETHSTSSRESTIIVDTTSGQVQPKIVPVIEVAPVLPVKLAAVPELFTIEEPNANELPATVPSVAAQAPEKKARKSRAKVPSWDEILFGASSTKD